MRAISVVQSGTRPGSCLFIRNFVLCLVNLLSLPLLSLSLGPKPGGELHSVSAYTLTSMYHGRAHKGLYICT